MLSASGPVLMRALSEAVGVTPRTITGLVDAEAAFARLDRGTAAFEGDPPLLPPEQARS